MYTQNALWKSVQAQAKKKKKKERKNLKFHHAKIAAVYLVVISALMFRNLSYPFSPVITPFLDVTFLYIFLPPAILLPISSAPFYHTTILFPMSVPCLLQIYGDRHSCLH